MKSKRTIHPDKMVKYTDSEKAPFICRKCGYKADTPMGMVMHWNKRHKEDMPAAKKPKVKKNNGGSRDVHFCPDCGCNIDAIRVVMNLPSYE
jgi:rubrerythrin